MDRNRLINNRRGGGLPSPAVTKPSGSPMPPFSKVGERIEERAKVLRNYFTDVLPISRDPLTKIIEIGPEPTRIVEPPHDWPYLLYNPAPLTNLAKSVEIHTASQETEDGNTQASPLAVANYLQAHFFLDVTGISQSWDFHLQTRDPFSGKWVDSEHIFAGVADTGTFYQPVGTGGIARDIAIRWEAPITPADITFSLGVMLKEGTPGFGDGSERTIFIGGRNVTPETGIPLFEGKDRLVYLEQQIELYAVAYNATEIKIFNV